MPSVVAKDFCPTQSFGLRRGDIFIRKGDSTVKIQTQAELEEILDQLEAQADEASLESVREKSPFAVSDGTYLLLEKGFSSFIGRATLRRSVRDAVLGDPRIWIVNVHGPGGVGKSALVNRVVYDLYEERAFDGIIQLSGKTTELAQGTIRPFGRSLYSLDNLLDHILTAFQETVPVDLDQKKAVAREILDAWKVLLVLDNMETVSDGRILEFVRTLPPSTRARVLLTSRHKTGAWELPVPVSELGEGEVEEFVRVKAEEIGVKVPVGGGATQQIQACTGGLPLAIQWLLGQFKLTGDFDKVCAAVCGKDSPVLEFSFRNIWQILTGDARAILAVLTIFDAPPTLQELSIATVWSYERIEAALSQLEEVTLVTSTLGTVDGRKRYVALPITLAFAKYQLDSMGEFEVSCRRRLQQFQDQITLQRSEIGQFESVFEKFGLQNPNERTAAILCRRAETDMFAGNVDQAELLLKQARELAPNSAYVFAMNASYELARNRVGLALTRAQEACKRVTPKTGSLCYRILARILDVQRDRNGTVAAFSKALEYEPENVVLRHQYGVALSRAGKPSEAVREFDTIIDAERKRQPPRASLLMALKTRIINLRRLGRHDEAQSDLKSAAKILADNPLLAEQAHEILELEDEHP